MPADAGPSPFRTVPFRTDLGSRNSHYIGGVRSSAPGDAMSETTIRLAGAVQKLIDRFVTNQPQQAQIHLAGADSLYDELRMANIHKWEVGAGIEVTIRLLHQAGGLRPRMRGLRP